jgi:hypothetical protein
VALVLVFVAMVGGDGGGKVGSEKELMAEQLEKHGNKYKYLNKLKIKYENIGLFKQET